MAERKVEIGLISYTDPDGFMLNATYGETIDVHEDDLERFDRLNGYIAPPSFDYAANVPVPVEDVEDVPASEPVVPTEAPRRGRKAKDTQPQKPAKTASKEDWVAYANAMGAEGDFDGVTRDEIAEMYL